jgi:hypothetical protein
MKPILAWHFVGATLRDGRPVPPDGEVLRHPGDLLMCASGLHASKRIIDAVYYAPGTTICRVRCGGEGIKYTDKLACTERTILWRVDGENLLRKFARQQALSVIHLWDAPAVVREYLETGDESKRSAAWSAAESAAESAADSAAWSAAESAADSAAESAARSAARSAAWSAAESAAQGAADEMLTKMVMEEHKKAI